MRTAITTTEKASIKHMLGHRGEIKRIEVVNGDIQVTIVSKYRGDVVSTKKFYEQICQ